MANKYVVYITMYTGNLLPKWYIGSSTINNIENGYNGSVKSKKWKSTYDKEQRENKHLFKTKVVAKYDNHEAALTEELRLQKMHNAVTNDNYYNESYASKNGFFGMDVSGENNPFYGRTHSSESRLKIKKGLDKLVEFEGNFITKRKMAGILAQRKLEELVEYEGEIIPKRIMGARKARDTMQKEIIIDGNNTTIALESAKKTKATMNNEIIINGEVTTKRKECAKHQSKRINEYIVFEGEVMTKAKKASIFSKRSLDKLVTFEGKTLTNREVRAIKTSRTKGIVVIKYNVYDANDNIVFENRTLRQLRTIYPGLVSKTKDQFLGKGIKQRKAMVNNGKEHMIGYYVSISI
jgi:hypothetical protein